MLYNIVSKFKVDTKEFQLVEQSFQAFVAAETDMYDQDRIVRSVNGEIVSESESDDPESYVGLSSPFNRLGKSLVAKKRAQIKRRARREKAKAIAERRILSHRISKKVVKFLRNVQI